MKRKPLNVRPKLRKRNKLGVFLAFLALAGTSTYIIGYSHYRKISFRNYVAMGNMILNNFPNNKLKPIIYVITPTYGRPTQAPDLTRLAQTLLLAEQIHWIVVEDAKEKSGFVTELLNRTGLSATHLNVSSNKKAKVKLPDLHIQTKNVYHE